MDMNEEMKLRLADCEPLWFKGGCWVLNIENTIV